MVGTRGASIGEGGSRHGMCEIKVKSQIKLEISRYGEGERGGRSKRGRGTEDQRAAERHGRRQERQEETELDINDALLQPFCAQSPMKGIQEQTFIFQMHC
jgi:hypothetical protein